MDSLTWKEFERVKLQIGTIVSASTYSEAKKPAYILHVDFGAPMGIKKSSAQITWHYSPEDLIGKQVLCVTNFPPKQIGKIMSEVLVTGFPDEKGNIVLCIPENKVSNGTRLI
jgi:tRNA-binding protein